MAERVVEHSMSAFSRSDQEFKNQGPMIPGVNDDTVDKLIESAEDVSRVTAGSFDA